ncbi:MAG TPA: polysaccharide biosynthesis/export family protein [Gemmatimonadaceae bacterium]|nr:polysaccharide biosynthesis/export family protein [Gemmatimonadaceae bacterium]
MRTSPVSTDPSRRRPRGHRRMLRSICLAVASVTAAACASGKGTYVWVDDYPVPTSVAAGYTIGVGDLLDVQVWDNDKLSTKARVRTDGRISVPLLDDIVVVGKTPEDLARELERQLAQQNLVLKPRVSVAVTEMRSLSVSVLGAVAHPGIFTLEPGGGVAEALASAGGLTEFAHKDRIFVVRRTPQPVRIRFTFSGLTGKSGHASLFRLRPGDVVVAE